MTIGELAAESGTPASTIRYWEKIGVLPRPARISGQRRYGAEAVERLAVLRLAQDCGFRLDEMRRLLNGFETGAAPPRRWQELGRQKLRELDEQIARLNTMRQVVDRVLQCRCVDLTECGRRYRACGAYAGVDAGMASRRLAPPPQKNAAATGPIRSGAPRRL